MAWAERLESARDEIVGRWGETLYRRFRLYLWGSAHAAICVALICAFTAISMAFSRRRSGRPSSRLDALFQYQDQFLRNELPTTTNTAPMMIDIAIGHDHYH